jgi:hypothetical protein
VDRPVRLLCTAAGNGDLNAAKALIPWLNQALGMPTERVEHRIPSTVQVLEQMDSEQLARLVAKGPERRLRAVSKPADADGSGGDVGWRAQTVE